MTFRLWKTERPQISKALHFVRSWTSILRRMPYCTCQKKHIRLDLISSQSRERLCKERLSFPRKKKGRGSEWAAACHIGTRNYSKLGLSIAVGVGDLIRSGLFDVELDEETDDLTALLDQVPPAALIQEFGPVFVSRRDDLCVACNRAVHRLGILLLGTGTTGAGLPDVPLVVAVNVHAASALQDEAAGVEANAELLDHEEATVCRHGFC
mmetsp:Transcript_72275/g.234704  ORF Transcript_72275/g.234704 Transcript_72275/m.234704 type:complete len:210 (-) Transcript_72275:522-1151(-)